MVKLLPAIIKDALKTLVRALVGKPATIRYPEVEVKVPEGFRGRHWLDTVSYTHLTLPTTERV